MTDDVLLANEAPLAAGFWSPPRGALPFGEQATSIAGFRPLADVIDGLYGRRFPERTGRSTFAECTEAAAELRRAMIDGRVVVLEFNVSGSHQAVAAGAWATDDQWIVALRDWGIGPRRFFISEADAASFFLKPSVIYPPGRPFPDDFLLLIETFNALEIKPGIAVTRDNVIDAMQARLPSAAKISLNKLTSFVRLVMSEDRASGGLLVDTPESAEWRRINLPASKADT